MSLQRRCNNILPCGFCRNIFKLCSCDDSRSVSDACTGKLYAVGGYDGASRQCLSTVEEYNPVSNKWCYVTDMSTRRSGAGLFLFGHDLNILWAHFC